MRVLLTCRPLAGHYRPMLPLARAFARAGHEVAFASGQAIAGEAEADGFTAFRAGLDADSREQLARAFPEWGSLPPSQIRTFVFTELFVRIELGPRADDLVTIVEGWRPQLLVHDVAEFAAPLVATRFGIPYADHSYGPVVLTDIVRAAGEAAAPLWRTRGLSPAEFGGLYRHLYLDVCPPGLQVEHALPADVQGIRSFESIPSAATKPAWLEAMPGLPIVYATLGTVYNKNLDVFRTVIEGLRGEALNIVVTVGRQNDPAVLGRQPANVRVHRFVPQESLLPHCAAAVTHGGAGSTLGALASGLPVLVIPQGADQFYNAERVVAAGAGIALMPDQLTAESAREAVRELLGDDAFRSAAQRIKQEFESMPDAMQAVAALERLVARQAHG
jgi:UDP:flavonoid glycosyltransferase YjiC (YdhE family)